MWYRANTRNTGARHHLSTVKTMAFTENQCFFTGTWLHRWFTVGSTLTVFLPVIHWDATWGYKWGDNPNRISRISFHKVKISNTQRFWRFKANSRSHLLYLDGKTHVTERKAPRPNNTSPLFFLATRGCNSG